MRPKWLILILSLFLITGCSITKVNDNDYNSIINTMLKNKKEVTNTYSLGYEYYLPRNIKIDNVSDYNVILYTNKIKYYLYVDVISYYHKVDIPYTKYKKAYYAKELKFNGKKGYIEINKTGDKYFVEMMYNYSKIETYVDKREISQVLIDMCYILNNVRYNDKVIGNIIDSDSFSSDIEQFDIFGPKRDEGQYLDYIKEYDNYDGEETPSYE